MSEKQNAAEIVRAATEFVSLWANLAADDIATALQCSEAEVLADLFRAFGQNDAADALIEAHALGDQPEDAHYQGE